MVTLISQSPNQFELHLRAILGLPIPSIELAGPAASAVILADRESSDFGFEGVADALALGEPGAPVDVRLFAKPNTLKNRRMGVALARAETAEAAKDLAMRQQAASASLCIGPIFGCCRMSAFDPKRSLASAI